MKTKIFYLLLLITMISVISCSNDDEQLTPEQQLPPITTTGANTFGCLIDGVLFKPRDGIGSLMGNDRGLRYWGGGFQPNTYRELDAKDYKSTRTASLLIHIQNLSNIGEGEYIIDQSSGLSQIDSPPNTNMFCRIWRENIGSYQYYISFPNSGIVKINRFNNGIVSGTFEGSVRNYQHPYDTIQITNGRFDINTQTLETAVFP